MLVATPSPFFVPGHTKAAGQKTYEAIRAEARASTGHLAVGRRIAKLHCRRDGLDVEAEVGQPDPICGEMVTAILDLGRALPYLIHCGLPGHGPRQILVKKPAYSVTEFAP